MSDKTIKFLMTGILICLLLIALKPVPSFESNFPSSLNVSDYNGETVVQLAENRIAIVDTNLNSGMRGEIVVLEFNEIEKTFELMGRYNYIDVFQNSQDY